MSRYFCRITDSRLLLRERALFRGAKDDYDGSPALRFLTGFHYAYLGFPKEAVDQLNRGVKLEFRDEAAQQLRDEMQAKLPKPVEPQAAPATPQSPEALRGPARGHAVALAAA